MRNIVTHLPNGKITAVMSIPEIDFEVATQGQLWVEGAADPRSQYVDNGQIIDIPPQPGDAYEFDFSSKQWVASQEIAAAQAKSKRQALLLQSDWTDTLSAKARLGDALYQAWQDYRQALRDITAQAGYPLAISWPTPPGGQ